MGRVFMFVKMSMYVGLVIFGNMFVCVVHVYVCLCMKTVYVLVCTVSELCTCMCVVSGILVCAVCIAASCVLCVYTCI